MDKEIQIQNFVEKLDLHNLAELADILGVPEDIRDWNKDFYSGQKCSELVLAVVEAMVKVVL